MRKEQVRRMTTSLALAVAVVADQASIASAATLVRGGSMPWRDGRGLR